MCGLNDLRAGCALSDGSRWPIVAESHDEWGEVSRSFVTKCECLSRSFVTKCVYVVQPFDQVRVCVCPCVSECVSECEQSRDVAHIYIRRTFSTAG
jgi:hypothetical protein